ncbi:MAG TPA: DUF2975 domain-containing protein [Sphingomonas sp.]|jgi:hypothetical protein|nr:DUF2975 domain-containing protein [Sphingomonas sp.]
MTVATRSDPLLTITQFLLRAAIVLIAFTIAVCAIAAVALALFPDQELLPKLSQGGTLWWVLGAVAVSIVMLALYLLFTLNLSRIVATVGTGDPFQPENADRLDRMAWLTLAVQGCMIALAPLIAMIARHIDGMRSNFEVSLSGFLLALVLFILARVFRRGAEMRADLEGTV